MARPIDGNELVDTLKQIVSDYTSHGMYPSAFPVEYAIEIVEKMPTLTPPNEWVSVEDAVPDPGTGAKSYWVAKKDNAGNWQMKIAQYCDYGYAMTMDAETEVTWRDWDFTKIVNVTHWMPLPAPPGKDNNVPTNEPLTIEELREMDGEPAYWLEDKSWGIISVDSAGPWAGIPFFRGRAEGVNFEYDIESRDMEVYAYPPANIHREVWVSVEERLPEDEKDGETVLVIVFGKPHENITLHGAIMTAGYFRDEGWILNEYPEWEGPEVTHWMPLPSPPAELEKRLRGVRA